MRRIRAKKYRKILEEIQKKHGKEFTYVGLEGTETGEIKTEIFNKIKNKKIRENILEYCAKEGILSGAEIFGIRNSGKIKIFGIENKNLYLSNFESLYNSLYYKYKFEGMFDELEEAFSRTKKDFYVDELKKFEELQNSYKTEKRSFENYLKELKKIAIEKGIKFDEEYENLGRLEKLNETRKNLEKQKIEIELELKASMTVIGKYLSSRELKNLNSQKKDGREEAYYLYFGKVLEGKGLDISKNYKNLSKYLDSLKKFSEINEIKILLEKEELEKKIRKKMLEGKGDAEKYLENYGTFELMRKYLRNETSYYETKIMKAIQKKSKIYGNLGRNYL